MQKCNRNDILLITGDLNAKVGKGPGGHSLIWPIRGRAAGQGMVFGLLCPEQGIQFYVNLS